MRPCKDGAAQLRGAAAEARRSRSAGGERAIAIHALENLAHSDTGIVMLRRLLRDQLKRVEEDLDPINVTRDPSADKRIPTGAWNTNPVAVDVSRCLKSNAPAEQSGGR